MEEKSFDEKLNEFADTTTDVNPIELWMQAMIAKKKAEKEDKINVDDSKN
jgi:thymidine phosphorylase